MCNGENCENHGFWLIHSEEDPSWQSLVISIADRLQAHGNLRILDVSHRNFPNRKPPSRAVQKFFILFGLQPVQSTIARLAKDYPVLRVSVSKEFKYFDQQGNESVESALLTLLRTPWSGPFGFLRNAVASRLRRDYAYAYEATRKALKIWSPCTVVVPNGRFPIQRGALTAARSWQKKILFYEKSWKEGHFYMKGIQTQDFMAQVQGLREFATSWNSKSFDYAETWLASRTMDRNHLSEIGAKFSLSDNAALPSSFLAIFSSSTDEFEALGELWPKPAWIDQYEAFAAFIATQPPAVKVVLRVHPNSRNKPISFAIWELRELRKLRRRFPNLKVISPMSLADSYDLALRSKAVCVWESTIGLEASYLRKKVYSFAPSMWAELCSAVSVFSPDDLAALTEPVGGETARIGALTFIQGMSEQDAHVKDHSSWTNGKSIIHFIRNALFLSGVLEWWLVIHQTISNRISRIAYRLML